MNRFIMICLLLSCSKNIQELRDKEKINEKKYWEYIIEDDAESLKEYLKANNLLKDEELNYDRETSLTFEEMNQNGETALTLAAKYNSLKVIKLLLENKLVNIDKKNIHNQNALICAILFNDNLNGVAGIKRYNIVDRLLKEGININARYGIANNNTLMLAIIKKDIHLAKKILDRDIDINAQNSKGDTALILLTKCGDIDIDEEKRIELMKEILDKEKLKVNLQNKEGKNALAYAIINNDIKLINILTNSNNIDINILNKENMTPFDYLNFKDFEIEIAIFLIKKGARINNRKSFYERARKEYLEEIIDLLIEGKGDFVYKKDNKNLLNWAVILFKNNMYISLKLTKYLMNEMEIDAGLMKEYIKYAEEKNSDIFRLMSIFYEKEMNIYLKENLIELKDKEDKIRNFMFKAVENRDINTLKKLLEKGANIEDKNILDNTLLMASVENNNIDALNLLICLNFEVNYKNRYGDSPLTLAASKNNKEALEILLKNGANVYDKDEKGNTPLIIAVSNNNKEIVEILLRYKADICDRDEYDDTALMIATQEGNKEIVELLLEQGANSYSKIQHGYDSLIIAISNDNKEILEMLLRYGANINEKDENGNTILIRTIGIIVEEILEILIKAGVNVSDSNNYGDTALIRASELEKENAERIVKKLIDAGADVNAKDRHGNTALIRAAKKVNKKVVKVLLESGAETNSKDIYGHTALTKATYTYSTKVKDKEEIAKMLIDAGADIAYRNSSDIKLEESVKYEYSYENKKEDIKLVKAIEKNDKEEVKSLLKKGIDVNEKDKLGDTPLIEAVEKGNKEIVSILLKNGADVNYKGGYSPAPLIIAIYNNNVELIKILIAYGADINLKDRNEFKVLNLAIMKNNLEVIKIILKEDIRVNFNKSLKAALIFYSRKVNSEKIKSEKFYIKISKVILREMLNDYENLNRSIFKRSKLKNQDLRDILANKIKLLNSLFSLPNEIFELVINFI